MVKMTTMTVASQHLPVVEGGHEGAFLTGLDNGYVVQKDLIDWEVHILFHTAEGDEATLVLPFDVPVTVSIMERQS